MMESESMLSDLTRRLAAAEERASKAEAALHDSEERFKVLFSSSPAPLLVVRPDAPRFTIAEVNDAYLAATMRTREELIWRGMFDAFPDNPEDPTANGVKNLRASFERTLRSRRSDAMPVQKYDVARPDGSFEERWWSPINSPVLDQDGTVEAIIHHVNDVTEERRIEAITLDSAERQSFLLKFSDALRAEQSEDEVKNRALRMMFDHLKLDRCYIGVFNLKDNRGDFTHQVGNDTVRPMPPTLSLSLFPEALRTSFEATLVIHDVATSQILATEDQHSFEQLGAKALVVATLRKGEGVPLWSIVAMSSHARYWSPQDVALIEEATERTWAAAENARAQAALRSSEARFQQFGHASSDGLWIRDAASLKLEYASDAMETIYGLSIRAMTADPLAWPALIVPEDRDETFGYIERVKAGDSVVHEFRIQRPTDLQFRWIRSVGFPLLDGRGVATRIAGISSDITQEKILAEHQGVLLHELQHRVRNIMGVIRSIGNRSAGGATSVEDYRQTLEGRMLALARVQALLTRQANAGGSLRDIIENEVKVQAHHPHQFELVGADIMLSPKAVEVLTMAFHELSTNALKYGAFSVPEGKLTVSWSPIKKRGASWLGIDWVETGAPLRELSRRRGFGSELIEGRIPYELGGIGKVLVEPGGARCRMEFPLMAAESILETDAPLPTRTFGGTIDMSGAPDLTGRVVLVVEDDYYIAADTVAALRGAGAEVLGPYPTEGATLEILETRLPTHGILDLNLSGGGPKFDIARRLKDSGVPFIFITGYDPDVIPPELADVQRLQKPVPFRSIVEAVSHL